MDTLVWLVLGLAAVDAGLLTLMYFAVRRQPRFTRQGLLAVGGGLAGFVFHALMFFDGGFLIVQLATIAGAFAICAMRLAERVHPRPECLRTDSAIIASLSPVSVFSPPQLGRIILGVGAVFLGVH